jgi:hypothetical protein
MRGFIFVGMSAPSVQPVTVSYQIIMSSSLILDRPKFRYLNHDLYNISMFLSQVLRELLTVSLMRQKEQ